MDFCLVLQLWVVSFSLCMTSTFPYPIYQNYKYDGPNNEVPHIYTRYLEVEDACKSILSSASILDASTRALNSLRQELYFPMGDWREETGDAPLMPFDGSDAPQNSSYLPGPLNLTAFVLTNVDAGRKSHNSVNVSGMLDIGMYRNDAGPEFNPYMPPDFTTWPGGSSLSIMFEGVYTETRENGGEMVLCLLGTSTLPSRQLGSTDPWEWIKNYSASSSRPHVVNDDNILLVLRYPMSFTLTSRAIRGEMRSLNKKSSLKYFDKVLLTSQLGAYSNYNFDSEKFVSAACKPYPHPDDLVDDRFEIYKGTRFCEVINHLATGEVMNVIPNWTCNSTDDYCRKLGPFAANHEIKATDGGFTAVGLVMQDIRCEPSSIRKDVTSAKVSAVFRVISPSEDQYTAAQRTGLSDITLSAEGVWDSMSGQLCMIGCLGLAVEGCHSRICLYIPTSFSISQRSTIVGRISNIDDGHATPFFPLSFERPGHPRELWNDFETRNLSYKYSKIKFAGALLERNEPFDFGSKIKRTLLRYPSTDNSFNLAEDLTLHVLALPDPLPKSHMWRHRLHLEVLSLNGQFGGSWSSGDKISAMEVPQSEAKTISTEKDICVNISAELTLEGEPYRSISVVYLEGLYNPEDGKMYLVGCRDVRASWKILFESMDLEYGLDCLIEVIVEYPPTTACWIMNPAAKISITSKRNDDDPLHFSPVKLQTLPILYQQQRQNILSRRTVEGIFRIFTLSIVVACILSQLSYIKKNANAVPYISLVMLGVQAVGYSIPLVTGAETLFARMTSQSYFTTNELENDTWYKIVDYPVKVLVLSAFLLTLRLGQKVWRSRIRLLSRTPLEKWRVPIDRRVFAISLFVHAIGFLIVIMVSYINAAQRPSRPETFVGPTGKGYGRREWSITLEEYIGLVQDFFLIPQIIGNFCWAIKCNPLRKVYYIGLTIVRLLPHVYDYVRAPVFDPYFSTDSEFVDPRLDFYSRFGDIAIPVTATLLMAVVFIQQKWGGEKLPFISRSSQKALFPSGSRVYERLPSMSQESELVSGLNEVATLDKLENTAE